MASSRSTNTMEEFLRRILSEFAEAKTLPDADLEFLIGLETTILQKLRQPVDAMQGQGLVEGEAAQASALPSGGDPAMAGAMPGGAGAGTLLPGGMGMSGAGGGGGLPGVMSAPQTIPPDELRRMLQQ